MTAAAARDGSWCSREEIWGAAVTATAAVESTAAAFRPLTAKTLTLAPPAETCAPESHAATGHGVSAVAAVRIVERARWSSIRTAPSVTPSSAPTSR